MAHSSSLTNGRTGASVVGAKPRLKSASMLFMSSGPQSMAAKYGELRIDSAPSGPDPSRSLGSSRSS